MRPARPRYPGGVNDIDTASLATEAIEAWLVSQALETTEPRVLVERMVERLDAAGRPVDRIHVAYALLHPLFEAEGFTWSRDDGFSAEAYDHREAGRGDAWLASPLRYVIANAIDEFRRRLDDPAGRGDFQVLDALGDAGFVDYVVHTRKFRGFTSYVADRDPESQASGLVFSFSTRRPGGFSDADLVAFRRLRDPFAAAMKTYIQDRVAHALATCYVGREAGQRVLDGSIHRGDGAVSPAVVLFLDMRDSTRLAETLPRERYIETLNRFFDAVSGPIDAAGGEIVAFLGDGALAIFPFERLGEAEARRAALAAVTEAFALVAAHDAAETGEPPLAFGAALHAGDVSYGNIGAPERLAWSVIGPVVNETARLQDLTKELGEPLLASGAFVGVDAEGWRPLGERRLRGVGRPMAVFAPEARGKGDDSA